MVYSPKWRPQKDGSTRQWQQCAAVAGANSTDRHRMGVKPATPYPWLPRITRQSDGTGWNSTRPTMAEAIFKWCLRTFNTTAPTGLYQKWVNAALKAMYGVTMGYAFGVSWATFVSYIVAKRGASVTIMYSKLHGTPYDACRTFDGRHRIYINERRYNSTKGYYEYKVYDGLADRRYSYIPQGPQWWPAPLLRRAMEAAGIEVSYTRVTT